MVDLMWTLLGFMWLYLGCMVFIGIEGKFKPTFFIFLLCLTIAPSVVILGLLIGNSND